eukprot:SAG31_NODE_194_length_20722_cov_19.854192_16_plen_63_part_00
MVTKSFCHKGRDQKSAISRGMGPYGSAWALYRPDRGLRALQIRQEVVSRALPVADGFQRLGR